MTKKSRNISFSMHAGGEIYGTMLTNSRQAYEFWRENGCRNFEFDIQRTKDGNYVTAHDLDREVTAADFILQRRFVNDNQYVNGMDLEFVLSKLDDGQITNLMLDPKDFTFEGTLLLLNFLEGALCKYCNIQKSDLVLELYNPDMIKASQCFPELLTYQYCVDDDIEHGNSRDSRKLPPDELLNYLLENSIHTISYPWKQAVENLPLLKMFVENDFIIYSRTRNELFVSLLKKAGVNINIVDHFLTAEQRIILEDYKQSYFDKYRPLLDKVYGDGE